MCVCVCGWVCHVVVCHVMLCVVLCCGVVCVCMGVFVCGGSVSVSVWGVRVHMCMYV